MTTRDWATDLIEGLKNNHMVRDDATRLFCREYAEGDTVAAWERYSRQAEQHDVGNEEILIFADGSVYVSWQQGGDKFYPDINMVREQYPEEMAEAGL